MSVQELKRLHIVKKAQERLLTQKDAANMLDLSERQFRRIIAAYRLHGERGVIHKLRGAPSPHKFHQDMINKITSIYQKDFLGYKPTFFCEKLESEHSISISKESTRQILITHGFWDPKHKKKKYRTKRERKHHAGELVQYDGSVHQWFEGPEGYCVLMLFIDDATSRVYARFYTYEGTIPAMDSFRRYIQSYGIPLALYTDLHSTYRNNNKKLSVEEQLAGQKAHTQFSRALQELSVTIIPAFSPQAKGRVERAFQTVQDRLCKELRRHKITTLQQANDFLLGFLKDHNRRFAVQPTAKVNLHRPALPSHVLAKILCLKNKCSIGNDFTIRHNNRIFQLQQSTIAKKAIIEDHLNGNIVIRVKTTSVPFKEITHKFIRYKNNKNRQHRVSTIIIDPISLKEVAS